MATRKASLCFVMTPFKEPYDSIYQKILAPAIGAAGLVPVRGDQIRRPGDAVAQIWNAIREADICVADISETNPNVMYELGLAHAMQKQVILLIKKTRKAPFNLTAQRQLPYSPAVPGWELELRDKLVAFIAETMKGPAAAAQTESQAEAVLAITAAAAQRKDDFLSFFGSGSLKGKHKAVFFDAQLPRLDKFCSSLRNFDTGLLEPQDTEFLKRIEELLQCYDNAELRMVEVAHAPRGALHALPKGIRAIVPWQELEVVLEIDRVFQEFGGKLEIAPDRYHRGGERWPEEGCLSLGLGFNNLTVEIGEATQAYKVFYNDHTDDFHTYTEDGSIVRPKPDPGFEYALFARVLLDLGGEEPTPYVVCAGHTADGTSAACHYLATKWQQIWTNNREDLMCKHMTGILYHRAGQPSLIQELSQIHFRPYRKPMSS